MQPETNHGEVSEHEHWIIGLLDVCGYGFFFFPAPLHNTDIRDWYFRLEISIQVGNPPYKKKITLDHNWGRRYIMVEDAFKWTLIMGLYKNYHPKENAIRHRYFHALAGPLKSSGKLTCVVSLALMSLRVCKIRANRLKRKVYVKRK